jgi:protocatechuate 3,4-dioxygenase beta subunit
MHSARQSRRLTFLGVTKFIPTIHAATILLCAVFITTACTNLTDRFAPKINTASEQRVIRGKVLDIKGNPITGARVQEFLLTSSNKTGQFNAEAESIADGTFVLNAPAIDASQRVYWMVIKPGKSMDVITGSGSPQQLRFVLGQAGTISGTVKDSEGKPISGAHVKPTYFEQEHGSMSHETILSGIPGLEITTDASGRFSLENLPVGTSPHFRVDAKGYATYMWYGRSNVPVANLDIVLERVSRWVSIKGTLRHEKTGAPGVGVQIEVERAGPDHKARSYSEEAKLGVEAAITTTDTNGAFVFERLWPGDYAVRYFYSGDFQGACISLHTNKVRTNSYLPGAFTGPIIPPADITVPTDRPLELNLKWTDGAVIRGRIIDSKTKKPVANVQVECFDDGRNINTRSDTQGKFQMHALPGVFPLTIYAGPPYQTIRTNLVLSGRTMNLGNIALSKPPVNEILVVDIDGKPVPNASIFREMFVNALAITDAQGRAQLTDSVETELAPHPYPWYEVRSENSELAGYFLYPKKDRTNVTWVVRKCSSLTGELRTPEGAPAVGVRLYLERTTQAPENHSTVSGESRTKTDAQGRFKMDELVPGTDYCVVVSGEVEFQSCRPFHRVIYESGTNIVMEPVTLTRKSVLR